jgi:phage terminase small subunit
MPQKPKRAKAGTSKSASAVRRKAFVAAYLSNGRNGTQAAITAGYPPKGAAVAATRLLKDANIISIISERTDSALAKVDLTAENILQEVARLALFDPRKMFDAGGKLLSPDQWDDATAAAIASLEITEEFEGSGPSRTQTGVLKKVKLWDKNSALEKAMKHLGLFEKDNKQQAPVAVSIELVG